MISIAWWPVLIVVAVATFTDIRSRRIPNWLVVPFLVLGILVSAVTAGFGGLVSSLEGIAVAAVAFGILVYMRAMGMGDLKLLAAIGAWIGPAHTGFALFGTAIAGGFIAVAYALWRGSLGSSLDSTGDLLAHFSRSGVKPHKTIALENPAALKVPYAPAIAIGALFSFFT